MRAMVATRFGPPEVLKLQERPEPRPGPEDLLIEVHAAGVNPVDFKICRGAFREGRTVPFIPGYDVSGLVRELGPAVRGFKIDESIKLCRRLGADAVINYSEEDFVQRVERETEGRGCPIVFDAVGGQTFDRSLDCVAVNGRIVTIVGTPSPEIPRKLFRKNATLYFEFVGAPTMYGVHPERQGEILRAVAKLVDGGQLKPHVSRVISLEELPEGHRLQEAGHVTGKIVVRVKP